MASEMPSARLPTHKPLNSSMKSNTTKNMVLPPLPFLRAIALFKFTFKAHCNRVAPQLAIGPYPADLNRGCVFGRLATPVSRAIPRPECAKYRPINKVDEEKQVRLMQG